MSEKRTIKVDVVSDVMCPWCYIGKRRLEDALEQLDDIVVDLRWRPFQLDATLPPEGKDRKRYLEQKFGGPDRAAAIYQRIRDAGAEDGIAFDFDAIEKSPNTLDAHRLIRWAQGEGEKTGDRVVEALFRAFFLEGQNIGDHDVLTRIASNAGMDAPLVRELLASDRDKAETLAEIEMAQRMGVTGVPCFVLADKYAVQGAQDATTLVNAIREVAAMKTT